MPVLTCVGKHFCNTVPRLQHLPQPEEEKCYGIEDNAANHVCMEEFDAAREACNKEVNAAYQTSQLDAGFGLFAVGIIALIVGMYYIKHGTIGACIMGGGVLPALTGGGLIMHLQQNHLAKSAVLVLALAVLVFVAYKKIPAKKKK